MLVGIFLLVDFFLMLVVGLPMMFAMASAVLVMIIGFAGQTPLTFTSIASMISTELVSNNVGITIALFVVSGNIMSKGQISDKIFNVLAYFFGKKRGFMPILAVATCMVYGAISGSSPGTTAAVASICLPLLIRLGYDPLFSGGLLVCAGCLGTIIPPSLQVTGISALSGGLDLVVLYKVAAIMGISCGVMLMLYSYVYCLRHGNGDQEKINAWVDGLRVRGFKDIFSESIWALLTPLLVIGVIFAGIADTAQAAALSAVYAMLVSTFVYKTIKPSEVWQVFKNSIRDSAPMLCMIAFSGLLTSGLRELGVVDVVTYLVNRFQVSPFVFIVALMIMLVLLGTVNAVNIIMFTPVVYPIIEALGLEPYTAMMAVMLTSTTGSLTPPVGMCLFVVQPMLKCSLFELGKKTLPGVVIYLIVAAVAFGMPWLFSGITAGAFLP